MAVLLTCGDPSSADAQTSLHGETSASVVFGVPVDRSSATPALLVRVGAIQERADIRVSGRLSLEGAWHPRTVWASGSGGNVSFGAGYDVRVHGPAGPQRPYVSFGLGIYRDRGSSPDSYTAWWLMPRMSIGGPLGKEGASVGWELGAQYAGVTSLGSAPSSASWFVFPIGLRWRFR